MKKLLVPTLFAVVSTMSFAVQAATTPAASQSQNAEHKLNAYEEIMVGKVWTTTEALDQDKKEVNADDKQVANFFGLAEYYPDGTFNMTTFDGKPKMKGDWSFDENGKTRSLTAKDDEGKVLFTRVVENVTVTPEEYTYRIYPEQDNKDKYFDIVHKAKK
ncbi:DUF4822 domain-containing protein [Providencia rettgeri]|uniref:DUF4822 domain-containing protein n=2 Tax=Providencia TaxID=586 RepID=A0A264VUU1_PRORE|nr:MULTISPECIES: DUF4822 domain-containing protein [Providencia]MBN6367700.1 DUF4822 domain-containing protein [Providencia rettgeri]MBQ0528883.1 DUF4822 domain-containing protein [Providencia rettgeri]MCL0012205.1 DUF4822 domain-containing protein [Providencia rettgeri]MDH2377452.1 DUF4822 domain-containing protein [Providencia rettgeri]OZS75081.1 DUF4822 domain-containing protein [Providencia rettgeri]